MNNGASTLAPTGKITPQAWMTAPQTMNVFAALTAGQAEVRFVGGCVRDAVCGRPVRDIDIATAARPERVVELLKSAGFRVILTGFDHGTVTAITDGRSFDVTSLRVDVETDGRRARVAFTDDWVADAARRDFTINALSSTTDGDIYDPFGGIDDLNRGLVRFVGNARERIEEDVLRLLRYFRFFAHYGRPPIDLDALAACRALAPKLSRLSGERVRAEMLRILLAPEPADVILLMRGERILDHILPEAGDVGYLRMMSWLESRALKMPSVGPDALRRLASLLSNDAAGAEKVAARWRLSNTETTRLTTLAEAPLTFDDLGQDDTRRALRTLGADLVRDLVLLDWAGVASIDPHQPHVRTPVWTNILEAAEAWTSLDFPLKGRDILALGIAAGPEIGRLLGAAEAWWDAGGCRADRDACLAKLKTLAGR
jgi:poly(A) polymerase